MPFLEKKQRRNCAIGAARKSKQEATAAEVTPAHVARFVARPRLQGTSGQVVGAESGGGRLEWPLDVTGAPHFAPTAFSEGLRFEN